MSYIGALIRQIGPLLFMLLLYYGFSIEYSTDYFIQKYN